jgi:hypothetical protein
MSTLETRKIEPLSGTTVTLGAAGDAVTVPTGATLKSNTLKDAGGNTLWTSDGSGSLSSINSAFSPGMVFISSQTGANVSSIDFTSGLSSTYDEYWFVCQNYYAHTNAQEFIVKPNKNDPIDWAVGVVRTFWSAEHRESGSGGAIVLQTGGLVGSHSSNTHLDRGQEGSSHADSSGSGILKIFAPLSTNRVKHFTWEACVHRHHGGPDHVFVAGYWNVTQALNAFRFKEASGNLTATISLYGIR